MYLMWCFICDGYFGCVLNIKIPNIPKKAQITLQFSRGLTLTTECKGDCLTPFIVLIFFFFKLKKQINMNQGNTLKNLSAERKIIFDWFSNEKRRMEQTRCGKIKRTKFKKKKKVEM